jgi:hypothetical protein
LRKIHQRMKEGIPLLLHKLRLIQRYMLLQTTWAKLQLRKKRS